MAVFSTDFIFGNFILPNLQAVWFRVETDSSDESPERVLMVKEISSEMLYKMRFSVTDLITFTEEILNGKLHFLYSDR